MFSSSRQFSVLFLGHLFAYHLRVCHTNLLEMKLCAWNEVVNHINKISWFSKIFVTSVAVLIRCLVSCWREFIVNVALVFAICCVEHYPDRILSVQWKILKTHTVILSLYQIQLKFLWIFFRSSLKISYTMHSTITILKRRRQF
jgi:hypothetical protein